MLTDVTELSPQERKTARLRLGELADRFTVDGTLHTSQWQAVYRRTWRHPYVPCYYPELGAGPLVSAASHRLHGYERDTPETRSHPKDACQILVVRVEPDEFGARSVVFAVHTDWFHSVETQISPAH